MSALLETILTMSADEPAEGSLTSEPYALLDDGRAMWLVPVEGPVYRKVDPGQPTPWWFVEVGEERP